MKTRRLLKQVTSYVLALCMLVLGAFNTDLGVVQAAEVGADETTVYFYNSEDWEAVGAYVYNAAGYEDGQALGGWGSAEALSATELGNKWKKVNVPDKPSFSIIFYNKSEGGNPDNERTELQIQDGNHVYVTLGGKAYSSKAEAEAAIGEDQSPVIPEKPDDTGETTVYFYNSESWKAVGAYVYGASGYEGGQALGGWGSAEAQSATELGEKWKKINVPAKPTFSIIFYNKSEGGNPDDERTELQIQDEDHVYVTLGGKAYSSKTEAEAAIGEGQNPDNPEEPDGTEGTIVHFYNSAGWEQVYAYAYADGGDVGPGWPGTAMKSEESEVGSNWYKAIIPSTNSFTVIFNNNNGTQLTDTYIEGGSADNYLTGDGTVYSSKETAEKAVKNTPTTIYFLNSGGWDTVYAHAYANDQPVYEGTWPGIKAESAENEIDTGWWKVTVSRNASIEPFIVIFSDNGDEDKKTSSIDILRSGNNYVTVEGKVYNSASEAAASVGIKIETTVFFLNSKDWEEVGVYVYGVGEALGPWPGKDAEPAEELGAKWLKAVVPAKPKFNIIFFNKANDAERAELEIPDESHLYITGSNELYSSAEEAELAEGLGDSSKMTTVYFYNNQEWETVYAYVFTKENDDAPGVVIGASWPGKETESAEEETGTDWWKITVPKSASEETPFYVVFNDGVNQTEDILISNKEYVYVIMPDGLYKTAAEAEEAAANTKIEDGCEEGPNKDLDGYNVTYTSAGAALPYITYEAEAAETNAEVLEKSTTFSEDIQSEASGRQAVKLVNEGDYVEFTLIEPANAMVLRYNVPDSSDGSGIDSGLSMYINGTDTKDLQLTSKYAWVYGGYPYFNMPAAGKPHRFFDEMRILLGQTLPAGTTIKLQKDAGDTADNYIVDFVECELVGEALTQPNKSLSVTDYGAVADDGQDDYEAFTECIEAAKKEGKEVWIPAGTFNLTDKKALDANTVTIRGAGMWYTNLEGAGAAFKYKGTSKFYDFAMTGVATVRDDSGDLAGFENSGRATNITIQNVWMEHMKVGIWSANTKNLVVQGCRIRNTYADGINLCSGTNNAMVRNNNVRNTGDDCIAIWPWLANCSGNTIAHNTVQSPDLANGIAIYGGGDNRVEYNNVSDIRSNGSGICLGSEFDTAKGYTGKTTVSNNVLERCGSWQKDSNYPIGALWIWSTWNPMTAEYEFADNKLTDCSYEGILIDCQSEITGLNIHDIDINGATDAVYIRRNGAGEATIRNISGVYSGELVNNEDPNFIVNMDQGSDVPEDDYSEIGYCVTFDYNCDDIQTKTIEVEPGALITAEDMAGVMAVDREGYSLQASWYKDAAYKAQWNFEADTVQADTTLYALWLKETPKASEGLGASSLIVQEIRPQIYTGSALKPSVIVYANVVNKDGRTERVQLKANKDYKVTYKNNVNVYTGNDPESETAVSDKALATGKKLWSNRPYVEIKGAGSYSGFVYQEFEILPADIGDATIKYNSQIIANKANTKVVTSLKYKKALKEGTDYDVEVVKLDAEGNVVTDAEGNPVKVATTTYKANGKLNKAATIAKADAVAGTYGMTVTAKGNYTGEVTATIIVAGNTELMQKAAVAVGSKAKKQTWTGDAIELTSAYDVQGANATTANGTVNKNEVYTVKLGGKYLKEGRDFSAAYKNNVNVGTATLVLTGLESHAEDAVYCTGTKEVTFQITGTKFAAAGKNPTIVVKDGETTTDGKILNAEAYTGKPVTKGGIVLTSEQAGGALVLGKDYNITYKNNLRSGKATVTFTATARSGFTGKFAMTFQIGKASLADVQDIKGAVRLEDGNWKADTKVPYTPAGAKLPAITLYNNSGVALKEKTDYTVKYAGGNIYKQTGEVSVTLNGKGNFEGSLTVKFDIVAASVDDLTVTAKAMEYKPARSADYAPAVTVKYGKKALKTKGAAPDYKVEYANNTPAAVKAYIDYRNGVEGAAEAPAPTATVTLLGGNYDGSSKTVTLTVFEKGKKLTAKKVKVNFIDDKHYYEGGLPIRPRYTSIMYDPAGKFKAGTEDTWIDLSKDVATVRDGKRMYREDLNYDITWGANNKTGKGTMKITGKGIYTGTATVTFKIEKKPVNTKVTQNLIVDKLTYDWYIDALIAADLEDALGMAKGKVEAEYKAADNMAKITIMPAAKDLPIKASIDQWIKENETPGNKQRLDDLRWDAQTAFESDLEDVVRIDLELQGKFEQITLPGVGQGSVKTEAKKKTIEDPKSYIKDKDPDTSTETLIERVRENYVEMYDEMIGKIEVRYGIRLETFGDVPPIGHITATATIVYSNGTTLELEYKAYVERQ